MNKTMNFDEDQGQPQTSETPKRHRVIRTVVRHKNPASGEFQGQAPQSANQPPRRRGRPPKYPRPEVAAPASPQSDSPAVSFQAVSEAPAFQSAFALPPDPVSADSPIFDGDSVAEVAKHLNINDLTRMGMHDLRDKASQYGLPLDDLVSMKKQELVFVILKAHTDHGGAIFGSGALEILPDGYGFVRSPQNSYLPSSDDIYVSPSQIRLFNLKTGDTINGQIRSPKEGERFFSLLRIETINYDDIRAAATRIPFYNLTPLYPNEKLNLETKNREVSTRIMNERGQC